MSLDPPEDLGHPSPRNPAEARQFGTVLDLSRRQSVAPLRSKDLRADPRASSRAPAEAGKANLEHVPQDALRHQSREPDNPSRDHGRSDAVTGAASLALHRCIRLARPLLEGAPCAPGVRCEDTRHAFASSSISASAAPAIAARC